MTDAQPEYDERLAAAISGDATALAGLFDADKERLRRMIRARLDERLAARVDASDVLQDVFVEAQRRIGKFDPDSVPLFIWLRQLTTQRMIQLLRFHVGADKRTTDREIAVNRNRIEASSASLARFFTDQLTSISQAAIQDEVRQQVRTAIDELDKSDRDIISLRHFEQLTNQEVAAVLDINPSSASTRYVRALKKLKKVLNQQEALSEYIEEFVPSGGPGR